jgi:L-fuculose-phosphate aldolase
MRHAARDTDELLAQLCEAGALAVGRGLVVASGGNLSGRMPGSDVAFVTATGTWLDRLGPTDFSAFNIGSGAVVGGEDEPSVEWKLHQRTYQERADVNAIVHLHPQHTVLVDALGHEVRLVTLDHAYYVRAIARCPYFPAGSQELADTAAEAAREHNAIILAHHGCSALGDSVGMALRRAMNLEEAAAATYRLLAIGNTDLAFPRDWFDKLATV